MFNSLVFLKRVLPIVSIKGNDCLTPDSVGSDTVWHHSHTMRVGSWNVETLNTTEATKKVPGRQYID